MDNFLRFCKAVTSNPAFTAKDITGDGKAETFCNWATRLIAEGWFGFTGFNDLNANAIHAKLAKEWVKVSAADAAKQAGKRMVIASQASASGHGHVCFVVPGSLVASGKWGASCPQVANVGKTNGIMGANFAFANEPEYFAAP